MGIVLRIIKKIDTNNFNLLYHVRHYGCSFLNPLELRLISFASILSMSSVRFWHTIFLSKSEISRVST